MRLWPVLIPMIPAATASALPIGPLDELVQKLQTGTFVQRELASDELETSPSITLESIEDVLIHEQLSPEQRQRLMQAAGNRFINEPRGAMGIQLTNEISDLGLKISGPVQGFDAFTKLKPNDIISRIGDWPIRSAADLQAAIVSRTPGETVPVEVLRGAERMTFDITLGSWNDLASPSGVPWATLELAWAHRSRPYANLNAPRVIELSADERAWLEASNQSRVLPEPQRAPPQGQPMRSMIVVAGRARPRPGALAGVRLDRPLSQSAQGRANDFPPMLRQQLIKTEVDIVGTDERLRRLRLQLDAYQRMDARPQQLDQVRHQIDILQNELNELQRRAKRLRAQLAGVGVRIESP